MMSGDTRQIEDKPIEIGVRKKLQKRWFFIAVSILIVCGWLITKSPFIKDVIGEESNVKLDDYKTEVGLTTENSFGKLTLNEVIIEDNQLVFNATFVPADSIDFDYEIFFFPQVHVNGQDYTVRNREQTIVRDGSKHTISNTIIVSEFPQDEILTLDISYNKWNWEKSIDDPWEFQVEASQKHLLADKKIHTVNEIITLTNGNEVKVTKVVSTPISTTIYYQLVKGATESLSFKINSATGKAWRWNSFFLVDNEVGTLLLNRFDALDLTEGTYYIVPIGADDRPLGPSIQLGK
ncbi:MAG: DUF4179 domain-containing protein [Lysinibacillus sp.]